LHISYFSPVLLLSKIALVVVLKHLRQEVELRGQLTYVCEVSQCIDV
jgi:hypothetical protein